MKSFIITFLILIQASTFVAQTQIQYYDIKATILEEDTKQILPYATVFNKQGSFGTASNLEGYFELPNNHLGDTIVVSFLGYKDKILVVNENLPKVINLAPQSALLDEIVVVAKSDYLYDMVAKVRKQKKTQSKTSKTYFFLETYLFNEPIEIIECFYNGKYSDLKIDELSIKKGRIGIKPVNNRYYRSTESSRLFSTYSVFKKNKLFPANPLSIQKKELKRDYTLKLIKTFNKNLSKIYEIRFIPTGAKNELFSGTIWIDRTYNKLVKISLEIKDSKTHPFVPIGFNTIDDVDMEITKYYESINNEQFINTIDFNYNISYSDKWGNAVRATTKAFIKAYDYNKEFDLPNFDFTRHYHEDYRNITVVPYDSVFWNRTTEFRFYDQLKAIEKFIQKNKIENRIIHPVSRKDSLNSQLQFPYITWNDKRFNIRQAPPSVIEKSQRSKAFAVDRFNLNVKLYLDINTIQDSLVYQIYSILDPVGTFYHFNITENDLAFMNMYFDLMEIQKRKFETMLAQSQNLTKDAVENIYQEHLKQFDKSCQLFIDETSIGKNLKAMEKWNNYILSSLDIDNFKFFNLTNVE